MKDPIDATLSGWIWDKRGVMETRIAIAVFGLLIGLVGCASDQSKHRPFDPTLPNAAPLHCAGKLTTNFYPIGESARDESVYIEPNADATLLNVTTRLHGESRSTVLPCHDLSSCKVSRNGDRLVVDAVDHRKGLTVGSLLLNVKTGEMSMGAGASMEDGLFTGPAYRLTTKNCLRQWRNRSHPLMRWISNIWNSSFPRTEKFGPQSGAGASRKRATRSEPH